jgi:aminoglycoside phosphotransferase
VHGDACLPNFVRIDSPEIDLAAAVWSLDHNLGPGFGGAFLRE